jgi:integrase
MIKEAERCAEGLEDPCTAQRRRPIGEHITEYRKHCRHEQQAPRHIQVKVLHLTRFIERIPARTIDDFTTEGAARVLQGIVDQGLSARTHNCHRAALLAFMNWAVQTKRVSGHELKRLSVLDERRDRRRQRRALTEDELGRLLIVARHRPLAEFGRTVTKLPQSEKRGRRTWHYELLSFETLETAAARGRAALAKRPDVVEALERRGDERALIYRILVLTGLRVGELASLKPSDFFLDQNPPFARLHPRSDKARRGADVPLRADLVAALRAWVQTPRPGPFGHQGTRKPPRVVEPGEPVFPIPSGFLRVLERDLRVAGVPKRDERGFTVDLHALRHPFGTHLSRSGVAPRTAQAAMRHSSIHLTMNLYTDPKLLEVAAALETMAGLAADCKAPSSSPEIRRDMPRTGIDARRSNRTALTPGASGVG